ncbi:MAG: glycoside hydrolase family 3 C-terminal domain-containing protein [Anaerolineae bacterium]|nr:MAG: glycoside hydrolase family 3 C-terminal domain-containing protein [Anaerolineae bacterium]
MNHLNFNRTDPEIEGRVSDLLVGMTLEEKVGQMVQIHMEQLGPGEGEARIRRGQVGSVLTIYGAAKINRLQRIAVEESRLGIPLLIGNDVIHGYRTIFPIPLAESCTWDPDLVEEAARIAAEEASADGTDWTFAPMVDICHDPRWGRIAEGAGEDPFLGAAMARARVRGFQARDLASGRKLVACPKHYAAYGAADAGKDYNTADISERTLRDVYLPPFKAAFDEGACTVMSAFNEIAGVPASANLLILDTILRREWDFPGVVLSDWNAVGELIPHGFAADLKEAAQRSALAGVDMDMVADAYHLHLAESVQKGVVPEAVVDAAARRVLRLKMMLGLFEQPYTDETLAEGIILKPEFRAKALEVTQRSIVLLKNDGSLLPLSPEVEHIALIGPLADDHHEILGCWHRIGRDEDTESVLDGFRAVLPPSTKVAHVRGCDLEGVEEHDIGAAVAAAKAAGVAVLALGEGEHMSGEAHSRAYLGLPGHQQALLEAVHATGTPVVVVLMSGRPLAIPWLAENVPAILQAWHGGIRAGRAVADVLFGQVNPSGKLTASWPRTAGQIPVYYGHKNTGRPAEGEGTVQFNKPHWSIYIDEVNAPQYPFGYGLSYTTFAYSNLVVETPQVDLDDTLVVTATVKNTGSQAGDEVVQLYVRDLVGSVTRPVKELKGFQRVSLAPGQSKRVRFQVPVQQLGFHGLTMGYLVEPGEFKVWVGPNAAEGLEGAFTILE